MRTKKSLDNILVSCFSYIFLMLNSFIIRGVFKRILGQEIVGIEGVFLNVVSLLGIVELGIGTGIVYKLYQPIADGDTRKIAILLNFYKKAYGIIAAIVLSCGFVAAFFVPALVKEDYSRNWLSLVFFMYVLEVLASYLFAQKRAMFTADQRNYVNNIAHTVGQMISCVLQITVLMGLHSYFGYLLVRVFCTALENVFISWQYKKRYGYIDTKIKDDLPEKEKKGLFRNIKALLFHKIGAFSLTSTSSMIIARGVDLVSAGIYSNYMLIVNGLNNITNQVFNGIVASFGNLMSTSTREKAYENFKVLYFFNYLIYSFFSISFFVICVPFMKLWMGSDSLFPIATVSLITLYFYIGGMRQAVNLVRTSAGIYQPDQYFPLIETAINLGLALILVKPLGINGVLVANLISMFLVPFWTQPYIIHKNVFDTGVKDYYLRYCIYAAVALFSLLLTQFICSHLPTMGAMLTIVADAAVCLVVPNAVNLLVFWRTAEFQRLKGAGLGLLKGLRNRRSSKSSD